MTLLISILKTRAFLVKLVPSICHNKMASLSETTAPLWKWHEVSFMLRICPRNFGLKLSTVHILNRTINRQLGIETPYEQWFRGKPSIKHYRIFGSLAWIFVNKQQRTKLNPKRVKVFFVGYSSTSRAYCFWDPIIDKIIESSDYIIDKCFGKYPQHFPPDPRSQDFVYLLIDSLSIMTNFQL